MTDVATALNAAAGQVPALAEIGDVPRRVQSRAERFATEASTAD